MSDSDHIAVIGTAFRFPGGDTRRAFWRDIRAGTVRIRHFGADELTSAGVDPREHGESDFMAATALLPDIDGFDAGFFGLTDREAAAADPQQRIFLECCHHALEDGGYAAQQDVRVGVYATSGFHLYPLHSYLYHNVDRDAAGRNWVANVELILGNHTDFLATQTAYRLGLTGPAFSVQSACSSGLIALHVACQGLRAGDADLALTGASAVHVPQVVGYQRVRGSILSPTGECRAFDAGSNGTVGGQGVAVLLLKRLDRALADGDTVHAVIEGIGVTNDGSAKKSFTAPTARAQRDAVLRALANADLTATDIGYVETHGTGTYKGDPIEFAGLTAAYREHTDEVGFCALGAGKPAIGHSDVCSGFAGLIRAMLVLRHGEIPPIPNFGRPNPLLALEGSPFYLPSRVQRWPGNGKRRRAGVQALGVGGTNVHVVLAEPPRTPRVRGRHPAPDNVVFSARGEQALRDTCRAHLDALASPDRQERDDLVTTLAVGRRALSHRLVLPAADLGALRRGLNAYLAGQPARTGVVPDEPEGVALLASGQGGRLSGCAAGLYDRFAVVRSVLDEAEQVVREFDPNVSLLAVLREHAPNGRTVPTSVAQPALFALQAALVALWRDAGIAPSVVAGHSVGEFGALHAAGALGLADGVRLTARRGALMRELPEGGMLAVLAARDDVDELLRALPALDLAAVNGSASHVIAGPAGGLAQAADLAARRGLRVRELAVDRAFHSRAVDRVVAGLAEAAAGVRITPVRLPFVSTVDGEVREPGWLPCADYLTTAARQPVRFDAALRTVRRLAGCAVEIGADGVLGAITAGEGSGWPVLASIGTAGDAATVFDTAAELFRRGHDPRWSRLLEDTAGARVALPVYPFQHRRYWTGPPVLPVTAQPAADADPARAQEGITDMTARGSEVLARVVEVTARWVGAEVVDPGLPFTAVGADSLHLVNMVRELEQEYGVRVSVRELLERADSPRRLADLITERAGGTPELVADRPVPQRPAPVAVHENGVCATQESVDRLAEQVRVLAQAQLDLVAQLGELMSERVASPVRG